MENYNSSLEILEYVQDTSPDPVEEYIRSFSEFPDGWNFGEGKAPSGEVINKAIKVYRLGKSFGLMGNAFPLGDGEIEISFSYEDHFIDILITGQNTLEYTYEIGIGDEYDETEHIENLSFEEAELRLRALEEMKPCDSSESSMQDGLTGKREDSKVVALENWVPGSPSLIETVLSRIMAPQYAATSEHSMQLLQENLSYIGHSIH
jgi:hypothetical protein